MQDSAHRLDEVEGSAGQRLDRLPESDITLQRFRIQSEPTRSKRDPFVAFIAIVLALGTLFFASSLLVPIVVSLLAYLTLRPIVSRLCSFGVPQAGASGLLIIGLFAVLAGIVTMLYSPAQKWVATAPASIAKIQNNFASIAEPLTILDRAEDRFDEAANAANTSTPAVEVSIQKPGMVDQKMLLNTTGQILAFVAAIAVLTFFMLSTGDDLLNRILNMLPSQGSRDVLLSKIGSIQHSVGKYLAQITFINIGLGIAVSAVMWAVGMPTPVLWGVLATMFNFIPYVGPLGATSLVFLAAASTFDTLWRAGITAGVFWSITAIEGQFVTPSILGRTLKVGPVVVLIAVAFWGFLWGLPGVFLAVPLLIVARQIFASFESTQPIAVVLGEDACEPGVDCATVQEDQLIAETA